MFIRLVTSAEQRNRIWVHLRNWISESCLQNMALSTLLILAICRTCVIFKLRSEPRSPQSLCGSVVEHQSAESEGLRFDSSRRLQNFFFVPRSWHLYLSVYRAKELPSFLLFHKTFIDLCCFYVGVRFLFGVLRILSAPRKRGLEWNQTFGR